MVYAVYVNYVALAIDPFLGPCYDAIAYRLPLMPICSAIPARAPARAQVLKKGGGRVWDPGHALFGPSAGALAIMAEHKGIKGQ